MLGLWHSDTFFYALDERRRRSPEADYGVWWRGVEYYPTYRLSWVEFTGELYLVKLGMGQSSTADVPHFALEMLSYPPGTHQVIGHVRTAEVLDQLLNGWENQCEKERSLQWVHRIVEANALEAPLE